MKNIKNLKLALYFFFLIDAFIFLSSQLKPELFLSISPQFNVGGPNFIYPRVVGILFLMIGFVRLYGGIYIQEKGAYQLAMISWVVEIIYILIEIVRGLFSLQQNLFVLMACLFMLIWSLYLFKVKVEI